MNENKIRGPLVTLAAVAALGGGLWFVNVSQETATAPPSTPVASSTTTIPPAPPPPSTPPQVAFPAKATYVGKIPIRSGVITLDITVNGKEAVAYVCDGKTIEAWLKGSAMNGVLSLASKDETSRLDGRLEGASPDEKVVGKLWIGEKTWDFTTGRAVTDGQTVTATRVDGADNVG